VRGEGPLLVAKEGRGGAGPRGGVLESARRGESDVGVGIKGPDLPTFIPSTSSLEKLSDFEPRLSLLYLGESRNLDEKLSCALREEKLSCALRALSFPSLPVDPMLSLLASESAVVCRREVGVGEGVPRNLGSGLALEGGLGREIRLLAIFSLCTEAGRGF
jgi:hypothetical protein